MSDIKDDPREVLALLNSLGFVGITAPQLKAFMKDLKMHRKIKDQQRQQWKEEARKKILSKQENTLKQMLRNTLAISESKSLEDSRLSESSSRQDDSLVRIRVRCVSDDEDNENIENETRHNIRAPVAKSKIAIANDRLNALHLHETARGSSHLSEKPTQIRRERRSRKNDLSRVSEPAIEKSAMNKSRGASAERGSSLPRAETERPLRRDDIGGNSNQPGRPLSAPEFTNDAHIPKKRSKSVASDPTGLRDARNNPSRCSARSQTKSFIRPWRLQPEAQRAASSRKSDPVALYQKYRQEWKQISFPGEEQHARVRWAIREKMLGTDPNPRPILKNSQSLQSIKKR